MRKSTSKRRYRGAALAEAAIIMMLLCTVTLGALQYGWFFYSLHMTTNAARQAARIACVLNGTTEQGEAAALNALGGFFSQGAGITWDVVTVDGHDGIKARVTVPIEKARLMPVEFLPVPDECSATVVMAKEGS